MAMQYLKYSTLNVNVAVNKGYIEKCFSKQ